MNSQEYYKTSKEQGGDRTDDLPHSSKKEHPKMKKFVSRGRRGNLKRQMNRTKEDKHKQKRGDPNWASKIDVWSWELADHCHLWKNARDGGILVSQQTLQMAKVIFIKSTYFTYPVNKYLPIYLAVYVGTPLELHLYHYSI